MNIAEKKRAEQYVTAWANRKQTTVRKPEQDAPPAEAVELNKQILAATKQLNKLGWETSPWSEHKLQRTREGNKKAYAEVKQLRDAIEHKAVEVTRRIWNNEVTFANIDEALEA